MPTMSISKEEALSETPTTTTITTTTSVGTKRKIDYIYIEDDSDSDENENDEDEDEDDTNRVDIFSEKSKTLLSARVSKCLCMGWRICGPCDQKYPHSSRETVDKTPPQLCKRGNDGSTCTNDWTQVPILPCVVCKRMTDDEEVSMKLMNAEEAEELICGEQPMCPRCFGMLSGKVCSVCNHNCTV